MQAPYWEQSIMALYTITEPMTKNAWDSSLNQMKSHHKWCDFDEAFTSITRLRLLQT